jgi:ADP-ribose pyrophosphatase YjhB (NUDIX family)
MVSSAEEIYQIADELRAIADLGLRYAENPYDRERYEHVLSASARLVAALEGRSPDDVLDVFKDNLGHVSPNAGAEATVFLDGRLLLIRREDDGLWALPGGLVEVGETLAQAAERELWEEAGVRGRAVKLLGIFDSRLWHSRTKSQLYHAVFLVESDDSASKAGPETTDVGFFSKDDLLELSQGHHLRVPFIFELLQGQTPAPYFDP